MFSHTRRLKYTLGTVVIGGYFTYYHRNYFVKTQEIFQQSKIQRSTHKPIDNLDQTFKDLGFNVWNHKSTMPDEHYFNDSAAYQLDPLAVKDIADASFQLHNMCLEAVDDIVNSDDLMELFEIPEDIRPEIRASWKKNEADILGRFDFAYDGVNPPKLLEYNADTPTLLIESSEAQAIWAEKNGFANKQFNYLKTAIGRAYKKVLSDQDEIVFAGINTHTEEWDQIKYCEKIAKSVGKKTSIKDLNSINFDFGKFGYLDENLNYREIKTISKLYPWEWLIRESIGSFFEDENHPPVRWIEPAWKMILSNKAILSYLWNKYPNHPNLLPSYTSDPEFFDDFKADRDSRTEKVWVVKPKLGRGGDNIEKSDTFLMNYFFDYRAQTKIDVQDDNGNTIGDKGNNVIQEYYDSPFHEQRKITFGSWIVNGVPAGICVREDKHDIIKDDSPFVPHYVEKLVKQEGDAKFDFKTVNEKQKELRNKLYGKEDRKQTKSLYETKKQEYHWEDFDFEETGNNSHSHHSGGGGGHYWGYWSGYNANQANNSKVDDIKQKASRSVQNRGKTMSLRNFRASKGKMSFGHISRSTGARSG